MKLAKIYIHTLSNFATLPKGDTIFGMFASLYFMNNDLLFSDYLSKEPYIIFSDFLPDGYFPKPTLPPWYFESIDDKDKKEFAKIEYIKYEDLQTFNININEYKNFSYKKEIINIKNSINRLTHTTDGVGFDPYAIKEYSFDSVVMYVAYDETIFDKEIIKTKLNMMGAFGFGKKSSTGYGHFEVLYDIKDFSFDKTSDTSIAISPFVSDEDSYYKTFTRYGKHGSHTNAIYKKPTILKDSGAVVKSNKLYTGKAIDNSINCDGKSLLQAYTILVPIKEIVWS